MTKFKVGDWWRTWGDEYVRVTDTESPWEGFPIETSYAHYHDKDGKFSCLNFPHHFDLIQKMKPPVWEEDNE